MSYYERRSSSYKNYSLNSFHHKQDRRPKKTFNITSYIKSEFLNADEIVLKKIANLYRQLYGSGPHKYLMDTFYSWKSGKVGLSRQTMRRILECVPKYLSDEKRFYILKCEILYFIETLHYKQQNKNITLNEINGIYESYANEISNFNEVNLSWFVGKGIFSDAEIKQFLDVCKYALYKKLKLSYRQVQNDLELIKIKLSKLKDGIFQATYHIDFLKSSVELSKIQNTQFEFVQFHKYEIKLNGIFKEFAEQFILDELLKMTFGEQQGKVNSLIKSNDLDFLIIQYNDILEKDNEAIFKSDFKGEGGQLNLILEVKSIKKLKVSLFLYRFKLFFLLTLFISSIILIFNFQNYKVFSLFILISILLGGNGKIIRVIISDFDTIKKIKLDLIKYGK